MSKITWSKVALSEKARLSELYRERADLTEEAQKLGMNVGSLERNIRNFNEYARLFARDAAQTIVVPPSPSRTYLDYETVEGDDWIIWGDVEAPDYNADMLRLVLLTAMRFNIRNSFCAGDLIAFDQAAFTTWSTVWRTEKEFGLRATLGAITPVLDQHVEWFTGNRILIGSNHDNRLAKATKGEMDIGMLLGDRVRYSHYDYGFIQTSRGMIRVSHPQNFSSTPVKLGQELYDVSPVKCHQVVAHCHHQQAGWTKDGLYEVHALGTCRDIERTQYKSITVNKHHAWNNGFLVVRNGYFYPYSLRGTNWREVLGDLYEYSPMAQRAA